MNMNKPPDETLKQGWNRSWLLVNFHLSTTTDVSVASSNLNFKTIPQTCVRYFIQAVFIHFSVWIWTVSEDERIFEAYSLDFQQTMYP